MIKKETIYFHRIKEENDRFYDMADNKEAAQSALYIGYEVKVAGYFNTENGEFHATHFDGVKLQGVKEI